MMLILLLVRLPLPFLLGRHMMADRTAARGAECAVVSHVTGDAADDGTLDAALGVGRDSRTGDQGEAGGGR